MSNENAWRFITEASSGKKNYDIVWEGLPPTFTSTMQMAAIASVMTMIPTRIRSSSIKRCIWMVDTTSTSVTTSSTRSNSP